jgi:hypothetical protein
METNVLEKKSTVVINPEGLLVHWQGHRALTRRVVEKFPEDKLFSYSVGGMRPFSELVLEMLGMAVPGVKGVVSGKWDAFKDAEKPATKADLLRLWDETTAELDVLWPQIPVHRFQEVDVAFGQYENQNINTILYFIDNEIHHRAQGYVYLRSLGIEPPPFWER